MESFLGWNLMGDYVGKTWAWHEHSWDLVEMTLNIQQLCRKPNGFLVLYISQIWPGNLYGYEICSKWNYSAIIWKLSSLINHVSFATKLFNIFEDLLENFSSGENA